MTNSVDSKDGRRGHEIDLVVVLSSAAGGGAERVSILLANELSRRGWSVAIVLRSKFGPFLEMIDPAIPVHGFETGRKGGRSQIVALSRMLKQLRPRTVLSAMVGMNIVTVLAAKLSRVAPKIVVTEHNQTDRNFAVARTLSARLAYRLIRFVYPRADQVVCVSQGVLASLVDFSGVSRRKMRVIHNPIVAPELPQLAEADCEHAWLEDASIPVVLAIGRLVEAKDFEMLLRAFDLLKSRRPCRLVILGNGERRQQLEALVRDMALCDFVDMPGFAANPYCYMKRAGVFALSSAWEGFPTVLVEALACGAPVVSTDCPSGPREILQEGQLGELTPVGDAEAFAEALDRAIGAPGAEQRIARGREFTVARAVDKYEALFHELHS